MDMQTIRNIKLINRLVELGNSVTVLAPDAEWMPNDNKLTIRNEVKVWTTMPPYFIKFQHQLSKNKNLKFLLRTYNILSNYILIPDSFVGWARICKNELKSRLKNDSFDIAITSSGSYTSHSVGKWISDKYEIKWIADYGDPYGLNIYGKKRRLIHLLEKRLLINCSGLFFTTQNTIDAYRKNYNLRKLPVFLLPCGFDYFQENLQKKPMHKGILVTYTGVAYSLSRNLSSAVIALSRLKERNVSFQIVGSYSQRFIDLAHKINATNVLFSGKVDFPTSLDIIYNADILIHIGNFGTLQIPGKTYIYLGMPKPIVYIRQEPGNDPTLELLNKFKGVVISENSPGEIVNSVNKIIDNYEYYISLATERIYSEELSRYSWKSIGDFFNQRIDEIARSKS